MEGLVPEYVVKLRYAIKGHAAKSDQERRTRITAIYLYENDQNMST